MICEFWLERRNTEFGWDECQTPKRIHEVPGLWVVGKGEEKTKRVESRNEANINLLHIFFQDVSGIQLNAWLGGRQIFLNFNTAPPDILYSWIRRLNIVKILFLSKWMYRLYAISIIVKIYKLTVAFTWKCKGQDIHGNLQEAQSWRKMPDVKIYYEAKGMKSVWYWGRERQIDHWNKIESPETDSPIYSHMIDDQIAVQGEKGYFQLFKYPNVKSNDSCLLPHIFPQINFRQNVDINVEVKQWKKIGYYFHDIWVGKKFLNSIIKEMNGNLDYNSNHPVLRWHYQYHFKGEMCTRSHYFIYGIDT